MIWRKCRAWSTRAFWRAEEQSPTKQGYHWNSNAETYYLIGEAMGTAMTTLCEKQPAKHRHEDVAAQVATLEPGNRIGDAVAQVREPGGPGGARIGTLAASEAVFELPTEDGTYLLSLGKVVYVRRSERETQIGFAATA